MSSSECEMSEEETFRSVNKIIEYEMEYVTLGRGDTKQSRLESTTEITQNKHVKVLHYFVDDIK